MFLGIIDTGALNDLERATKIAYAMVTYYGMSDSLPNVSYYDSSENYGFSKPYSEERARSIDKEVQQIIDQEYKRAREILEQYTEGHHALAQLLLEREVIYTEDAERIFGKRQWTSRNDILDEQNNTSEEKDQNDIDEQSDNNSEQNEDTTSSDDTVTVTKPPIFNPQKEEE